MQTLSSAFNNHAARPYRQKRAAKYYRPFSLRFTPEERDLLDQWAAGMPIARFIKWRLFQSDEPPPRLRGKFPVKDHAALAEVLAKLGQSHIGANMNQLARSANIGNVLVGEEVERALNYACAEVTDMRRLLVKALGLDAA